MRHRNSRTVGHGALDRPPEGAGQSAIPDVLGRHLRVLFCGINPGRVSAAAHAHFANPRNDFWRLLHEAGFTRRLLTPVEQWQALDDGVGVTNAAQRTTPGSSDLRGADFAGSAERLERLASDFEPVWLAFVGKEAYRGAFKERPQLGVQDRTLGPQTRLFVLPSTSPANAAVPWAERLRWFEELARASLPAVRPAARAIVLDRRDRIFLHRFVVPGDPGVWITPGGALEADESREDALHRELAEELQLTGVELGPWVWTRRHVWFWPAHGRIYDTREQFALVRVADVRTVKPTSHDSLFAGPDAREEHRWWTVEEIERTDDEVAPRALAAHLRELIAHGPPTTPVDVGR
ncbi:MAG: double-stranded uracil-DNA glycosylase [Gaiellaceae bacterium]|jgi:TDG/mug DNA glycosylase family protein|nr:double-stranded uracil-DNA glycosylase [Gaiellaceae bacterium]